MENGVKRTFDEKIFRFSSELRKNYITGRKLNSDARENTVACNLTFYDGVDHPPFYLKLV